MDMNDTDMIIPTDWTPDNSIIKVIGVGGGGCNAVTYMYNQKIEGCTFIVCNTDAQALQKSNVPIKIQLGKGLGAGTEPTKARNAAIESQDIIEEKVLNSGTEMLFITAGMGKGTGTGATPVIASMARKKGILTVGVVTLPYKAEGSATLSKAIDGINELEKNVDSLLIINNEKLYKVYGDLLSHEAFPKSNEVLATAVSGITDIISRPGDINVDFEDIKTMMKNSGMALMGTGIGSGENRLEDAVKGALESPLLNDFDLKTSKNVLVNITAGKNRNGLLMKELDNINRMINDYTGNANCFKHGIVWDDDPEIGDRINITVIATGFNIESLENMLPKRSDNIITIDEDYVFRSESGDGGEIELHSVPVTTTISYNTANNTRKFHFDEGQKPVMILEPGQRIAEIEEIPAIRRVVPSNHKENNEL